MKRAIRQFVLSLMWGAVKRRFWAEQPFVIAVCGSVGKTSTKEAIATMLEQSGRPVVKTFGNMATDSGIPLSLLGFTQQVKGLKQQVQVIFRAFTLVFPKPKDRPYWVLEYSSDAPGDHAFLGKRLQPDVLVVTSGGPVHMEYYKTQEGVIAEIVDMLNYCKPGGYVVVNGDDEFLTKATWPADVLKYGVHGLASKDAAVNLRGTSQKMLNKGMEVAFAGDVLEKPLEASAAVIGKQQLAPVVAAVLVGAKEGLSATALKKGVTSYEIPAGRGKVIPGVKDMTIIDDTANASLEAVVAGVAMLKPFAQSRRTVAVLGTMNELGETAEEAHRAAAVAAAKAVDFLVTVGPFSTRMLDSAKKAGMASHRMLAFATPEQLFSQLEQIVERNDIIYIKASQNGMRLERLVKLLMSNPADAPALLVRQTSSWR